MYFLLEFKERVLRTDLLLWQWERRTIILLLSAFSILKGIALCIILLLSAVLHKAMNLVLKVSMPSLELGLSLQMFAYLE